MAPEDCPFPHSSVSLKMDDKCLQLQSPVYPSSLSQSKYWLELESVESIEKY